MKDDFEFKLIVMVLNWFSLLFSLCAIIVSLMK